MLGAFLSTRSPVYGPAEEQFPAASHTCRLGVDALLVSVPAGTLVERVKVESPVLPSPETPSLAWHEVDRSDELHTAGSDEHEMAGAAVSSLTVTLEDDVRPAPSVAVQVSVVPAVSEESVVAPQPEEYAIPDSGSDTLQV